MNHLFKMPEHAKAQPAFLSNEIFPNCCGIYVSTGFPYPEVKDNQLGRGVDPYTKDEGNNKHLIESCRMDLRKQSTQFNSLQLIALNHIQNHIYSKMVKEEGFEEIMKDTYHPMHGHTLFLYAKKRHAETKPTRNH